MNFFISPVIAVFGFIWIKHFNADARSPFPRDNISYRPSLLSDLFFSLFFFISLTDTCSTVASARSPQTSRRFQLLTEERLYYSGTGRTAHRLKEKKILLLFKNFNILNRILGIPPRLNHFDLRLFQLHLYLGSRRSLIPNLDILWIFPMDVLNGFNSSLGDTNSTTTGRLSNKRTGNII